MAVMGLIVAAAGAVAGAAVVKELAKPPDQRTWHGEVVGVPYDFRAPTAEKVRQAFWDPDNPKLLTRHAFGVGWSVNLARLAALSEPATPPPSGPPPSGPEPAASGRAA